MKKFGTSNLPFFVGAEGSDIPDNDEQELNNTTDQFSNNVYSELKSLIETSGQELTEFTGGDINQAAKAAFIFSGKASYFTAESSTANNKILTSYNTGFKIPDFSLLDGFEFKFINQVTNTGNVTVLIQGADQEDAIPLLGINGEQLIAGSLQHNLYYSIRYIEPLSAFVLSSASQDTSDYIKGKSLVGKIFSHGGNFAPERSLVCNGGEISRVTYADLFAVIGTIHGAGNGVTTFNLPNIPEGFALLSSGGSGNVGQVVSGDNKAHEHTATANPVPPHTHGTGASSTQGSRAGNRYITPDQTASPGGQSSSDGGHTPIVTIASSGGANNLAAGVKLLTCINY